MYLKTIALNQLQVVSSYKIVILKSFLPITKGMAAYRVVKLYLHAQHLLPKMYLKIAENVAVQQNVFTMRNQGWAEQISKNFWAKLIQIVAFP